MDTSLKLASGVKMPVLGLGTWLTTEEKDIRRAVGCALDRGYKLIDTACQYQNEHVIGQVLSERFSAGTSKREDVFVTSKLANIYLGTRALALRGVERSLRDLQLDYIDLYLIHYPCGYKFVSDDVLGSIEAGKVVMDKNSDFIEAWKALEECVDDGRIKSLGVSNFNISQLERVLAVAKHPLCNIQVELNVYFQQKELVQFCLENDITVTAYAPLGSRGRPELLWEGQEYPDLMKDDVVVEIALKKQKTPAQVAMRFLLQQGHAVIPKSANPDRIFENSQLFDFVLSEDEMSTLSKLDKNMRTYKVSMTNSHPEYPW